MKKFALNTVLIGVLSFIAGWFGLWIWSFAVIAFVVSFFVNHSTNKSFFAAFLVVSLIWFFVTSALNIANEGQLASMVAELLKVPSSTQLIYITSLVGGLVAGFSAMTGSYARDAFWSNRNRRGERI